METMPDSILFYIISKQVDVRSFVSMSLASKSIKQALSRIKLYQRIVLPVKETQKAACPENLRVLVEEKKKNANGTLCIFCSSCGKITPVNLSDIVVSHRCKGASHASVKKTNHNNLMYYSAIDHLEKAEPCSESTLRLLKVPKATSAQHAN